MKPKQETRFLHKFPVLTKGAYAKVVLNVHLDRLEIQVNIMGAGDETIDREVTLVYTGAAPFVEEFYHKCNTNHFRSLIGMDDLPPSELERWCNMAADICYFQWRSCGSGQMSLSVTEGLVPRYTAHISSVDNK